MAPRGRKKKVGLRRMDAAIDAMLAYGFARKHIRKKVNELLKIYGGDEAWPFIEEYAYKELIEALLRGDGEGSVQEQVEEQGHRLKDKNSDDEKTEDDAPADIVGPSETSCSEPVNTSSGTNNSNAEGVGKGWKDILACQTSGHIDEAANVDENPEREEHSPRNRPIAASSQPPNATMPSQPPSTNNLPRHRRFPCYGWIESDEEDDDDFIIMEAATSMIALKQTPATEVSSDGNKSMGKRGSRWDQRPDDT